MGVPMGGEGVVDMGLRRCGGEGSAVLVAGGESSGLEEDFCDLGGDGAEGWMGCGRSGVAVGVILVIMSSPLPLPLRLPSPISGRPPCPPWPPWPLWPPIGVLRGASDDGSS